MQLKKANQIIDKIFIENFSDVSSFEKCVFLPTGPGSDSQEGYQVANLSPLFIVVGIILLIILVIVLFVFMRRRGKM